MKNSMVEKEDFSFRKESNNNYSQNVIYNKKVKRYISLFSFIAVLAVTVIHKVDYKHIDNNNIYKQTSTTTEQMTLQDLHTIKEQSANFVSQLSFSDKNINTVMYNLETNALMNLNASQSLSYFFIKKRQNNTKIDFASIKDSPPLYSKFSMIEGKKYHTISVPVIQTNTDLTTHNTEKSYSIINFNYEEINGKYILKSIN